MEQVPWMKADFDLGKVIASDVSGHYRDSLERALRDLLHRLEQRRMRAVAQAERERIDTLISACETAAGVIGAAHDASRAA